MQSDESLQHLFRMLSLRTQFDYLRSLIPVHFFIVVNCPVFGGGLRPPSPLHAHTLSDLQFILTASTEANSVISQGVASRDYI